MIEASQRQSRVLVVHFVFVNLCSLQPRLGVNFESQFRNGRAHQQHWNVKRAQRTQQHHNILLREVVVKIRLINNEA